MGPIIAATFGTVIKDSKLQFIGIKNELIGLALVTLVGFVFALIMCGIGEYGTSNVITSEIVSRGTGRSVIVGILIALPSGAAVAIAILGENIGSLVGVGEYSNFSRVGISCKFCTLFLKGWNLV
jgi:uncharacterized membrane protein